MSIDARLPLIAGQAATVDLAGMYQQKQQMDMQRQEMEMRREEMEFRKQLQAMKLDEAKKAELKAGLEDMHAAVQWADSPEKWAQVQQHYGRYDPQLAAIPFEQREQALVKLGQMGKYLEATKPDIRAIEPGGSLFSVGPNGVEELVRANPGQAAPASPVGGDRKEVGGKTYIKRGDQWFEEGAASNGGATF